MVEQFRLTASQIDDIVPYLKDGMTLDRITYEGETLGVELPITVDLVVAETEPGFAGDTATSARKAATMETGLVVSVPLFVTEGDTLRIDTRTGEYQTGSDPDRWATRSRRLGPAVVGCDRAGGRPTGSRAPGIARARRLRYHQGCSRRAPG